MESAFWGAIVTKSKPYEWDMNADTVLHVENAAVRGKDGEEARLFVVVHEGADEEEASGPGRLLLGTLRAGKQGVEQFPLTLTFTEGLRFEVEGAAEVHLVGSIEPRAEFDFGGDSDSDVSFDGEPDFGAGMDIVGDSSEEESDDFPNSKGKVQELTDAEAAGFQTKALEHKKPAAAAAGQKRKPQPEEEESSDLDDLEDSEELPPQGKAQKTEAGKTPQQAPKATPKAAPKGATPKGTPAKAEKVATPKAAAPKAATPKAATPKAATPKAAPKTPAAAAATPKGTPAGKEGKKEKAEGKKEKAEKSAEPKSPAAAGAAQTAGTYCDECKKAFPSPTAFQQHQKAKHSK
jgi:hypothetical protein